MTEAAIHDVFLLQGFDAATNTVCVEWRVSIANVAALRDVLAPASEGDPGLRHLYTGLSRDEMRAIGAFCRPSFVPDEIFTAIGRPQRVLEAAPYLVHTGFELPLMLEGRKPLAVFLDAPSDWFDDILKPFEFHVSSGRILQRVIDMPSVAVVAPSEETSLRAVLFALPGEEWRMDAYCNQILSHAGPWSDTLERLQGSLLGYEDWQNDWWLHHRAALRHARE